ncbi:MAG TPA: hypothetical protein VN258_16110 [Mobilitalea sp.]|nr:hypothetical protein [Mobilitalea sp.]
MNIENIKYAVPLSDIKDIGNDNIDIFVETDDGMTYTFVVTTPKNYYWYMEKEGLNFIPASPPDIIVRELTEENIRKALETFIMDNGYWLKLYFLAGKRTGIFETEAMDKIIKDIKKSNEDTFNG